MKYLQRRHNQASKRKTRFDILTCSVIFPKYSEENPVFYLKPTLGTVETTQSMLSRVHAKVAGGRLEVKVRKMAERRRTSDAADSNTAAAEAAAHQ